MAKPQVVIRDIDGVKQEPFERVFLDIEEQHQGDTMTEMSERKGDMVNMLPDGKGRVQMEFIVPRGA